MPAVLEADDADGARHWHEWVAALPGIENVEVVFVHWGEGEEEVVRA